MAHSSPFNGNANGTPNGYSGGPGGGANGATLTPRSPAARTVRSTPVAAPSAPAVRDRKPAAAAGSGGKPANPLKLGHALLRGRYKLAIPTALLLGATGAAIGYSSAEPMYSSSGLIEVKPYLTQVLDPTAYSDPIPMFGQFLMTQEAILRSPRTAEMAVREPRWTQAGGPQDAAAFMGGLGVNVPKGSAMISVRFTSPDPDLAYAGVASAMSAYEKLQKESEEQTGADSRRQLEQIRREQEGRVREFEADRDRILGDYDKISPTELQQRYELKQSQLFEANQQLRDIDARLKLADKEEAAVREAQAQAEGGADGQIADAAAAGAGADPEWTELGGGGQAAEGLQAAEDGSTLDAPPLAMSPLMIAEYEDLAAQNEFFGRMLAQRRQVAAERELDLRTLGETNPAILNLNRRINQIDRELAAAAARLTAVGGGAYKAITDADRRRYELQAEQLQENIQALRTEIGGVNDLNRDTQKVSDLIAKIDDAEAEIERVNDKLDMMAIENRPGGRVQILSTGDVPANPSEDDRQKFAIAGGVGGAALGIGLFALLGFRDDRLTYLDDPRNGELLDPDRVLAALPDMQGGTLAAGGDNEAVAFQLHKLRLALQRAARAGRRSFAVTSPASGDGKTSVALATALSLSASGTKTLLIDFDLAGKTLSRRFGYEAGKKRGGDAEDGADRGVGAVLRGAAADECFHATDVDRLHLMPCTDAGAGDARRLSPRFVRHVLQAALEHYEIVIIDTGPLLGSLEAHLVAGEADATVMCVSRGTDREMVRRGAGVLTEKSGHFEGLVLNRLDAPQFDRYVASHMSVSVPQNGPAAWRGAGVALPPKSNLPTGGRTVVRRKDSNGSNGTNGTNGTNGVNRGGGRVDEN